MATWTNNDGLHIKYGPDEVVSQNGGEFEANGPVRTIEVEVVGTELSATPTILSDVVKVPKGAFIQQVQFVTETAFTSAGSATLNIGLIRTDRSTVYDPDGFVAALALTSIDANGEFVGLTEGGTSHGALIGTVLEHSGLIVADWDTAAFTAGKGKFRILFYIP